ncbi:MAG: DUF3307 domain-containing protein [Bacillota bacterium]
MNMRADLLVWLIVGHMAGDYLFQTRWMANNKTRDWSPLLVHSTVYTGLVWLFSLPPGGIGPGGVLLVLISHLVLDRRRAVAWWTRTICQADDLPWMLMVVDQSWHLLVLALASLI